VGQKWDRIVALPKRSVRAIWIPFKIAKDWWRYLHASTRRNTLSGHNTGWLNMDTAYCSNGKTYFAKVFSRMAEAERAALRGHLECGYCGADAHFRKKSITGQKAHFAAHHHDDCRLIIEGRRQGETEKSSNGSIATTLGDRIVIRYGNAAIVKKAERSEASGGTNVRYATTDGGSAKTKRTSPPVRLKSILAALMNDPDFSQSKRIVQFADFPELPASEFFVSLTDMKLEQMRGERRGFWGKVESVVPGPSGLWLNNGDDDGPNVWIPNELVPEAQRQFGFGSALEQDGLIVLALGKLDRSVRTKYIKIDDLACLAVAK
jgi:hypothetical protein